MQSCSHCEGHHRFIIASKWIKVQSAFIYSFKKENDSVSTATSNLQHHHRPTAESSPRWKMLELLLACSSDTCPVEVRLGEALLSSPSTHSVFRVERPAGSLEGVDSIFLFGRRRGCLCVAAASGGGLSGWLITMFPPPLTLVSPLNGSRGRCRQLLHHCFL